MMNSFRFIGDMCHLASIVLLGLRLYAVKNARGISVKTQELYLCVFCARYIDLFTHYYSLYNSAMKIIYISSTAYIIYLVRETQPFKTDYERGQDSFLHWKYGVIPCVVLTVLTTGYDFFTDELPGFLEIFRFFSYYLEAIAILPQLILLQRYREVENLTSHYVAFLGAYRFLYILNWIYRSLYEPYYEQTWVVYICGVIQTGLYVDFFYYFFLSKVNGSKMALPK